MRGRQAPGVALIALGSVPSDESLKVVAGQLAEKSPEQTDASYHLDASGLLGCPATDTVETTSTVR